ncbi:MAG TPA: 4-hydroxy-tetrahydrodipicolinate reductase, partial [bacterium]|nr:4-hydroxy-tetrahydrodipicolinate reductase [bacterium]
MKTLKITVCGAAGRMGRKIVAFAAADPALEVVGAVEAAGSESRGRDVGELAGAGPLGVAVSSEMEPAFRAADAVVDFSSAAGAPAVAALAARLKKPLVVGTTGLDPDSVTALEKASREIPVVYASNMSVGMNLLFRLVEDAARALGPEYDIEIVEAHHRFKKDAPSGTARTLCARAARGRGEDPAAVSVCGREGMTGERPSGQIGLHAVRAG